MQLLSFLFMVNQYYIIRKQRNYISRCENCITYYWQLNEYLTNALDSKPPADKWELSEFTGQLWFYSVFLNRLYFVSLVTC